MYHCRVPKPVAQFKFQNTIVTYNNILWLNQRCLKSPTRTVRRVSHWSHAQIRAEQLRWSTHQPQATTVQFFLFCPSSPSFIALNFHPLLSLESRSSPSLLTSSIRWLGHCRALSCIQFCTTRIFILSAEHFWLNPHHTQLDLSHAIMDLSQLSPVLPHKV